MRSLLVPTQRFGMHTVPESLEALTYGSACLHDYWSGISV